MEKISDDVTKGELMDDFKRVVADAEALLKATASYGGGELDDLRAKAEESLKVVKARLSDERDVLMARTKNAAKAADHYIHENPWQALGVAAGVGLVVGLLTGRR
ncbi:MAG: YqjD family protein [Gammaproteobacteria bacterium]